MMLTRPPIEFRLDDNNNMQLAPYTRFASKHRKVFLNNYMLYHQNTLLSERASFSTLDEGFPEVTYVWTVKTYTNFSVF